MWCFGSMRMFLDRRDEFAGWRMSHDLVWEKVEGSGFVTDRFRRVHEAVTHWYRGPWGDIHHDTPRVRVGVRERNPVRTPAKGDQYGHGTRGSSVWVDDGTRLMRSVIEVANTSKRATHPTEKPVGILTPLIEYACPPGGTVLDPFAGSGSTAAACRVVGRKAVLIERDERYCEAIAQRLAQRDLFADLGGAQ
jgi:site-specific DNA-methyltransferase (adenine-specific)